MKPSIRKKFIEDEIERIGIKLEEKTNTNHWEIARDWLRVRSVYPQNHQGLGALMFAMTNTKVSLPEEFYRWLNEATQP
jgi:hypothetical protein